MKEKEWNRKHDLSAVKYEVWGGKVFINELKIRIVRPRETTLKKR